MAFKDILVHIDDGQETQYRLQAAAVMAQQQQAQLTGLYVLPWDEYALRATDFVMQPELIESLLTTARVQAQLREAEFHAVASEHGLLAQWLCVEGMPAQVFMAQARCHDLVVIGQADPDDPVAVNGRFAHEVILGAGRPVLVIPYIGFTPPFCRRVLIAWNGGREAVRAVHDALPLLAVAQQVSVLTIQPAGTEEADLFSSSDLCRHLARHGITAQTASIPADDIEIGDALLSRAADECSDLIIMGAYGHSRLREIVLGGTTQHLLKSMTVPVLMSH